MIKKAVVEPVVENTVTEIVTDLVTRAQRALAILETFDQAKIDHIVHQMAIAGLDQHMALAKMAVEETGRGIYEDKAIKNIFATEEIWHAIKDNKTVGVIEEDPEHGITKIAEPVGVIAGVTPVTNPTSTTIFKAEIAIKTRNPIIFAFHPNAQHCSAQALNVIKAAAVKAGLPADALLYIEAPSLAATQALMNHEGIATVLATGGPGMVKAAYSTGKPALGVGAGNAPAYIEASANIKQAVNDLILSKSFDNGMICASEQAVIVDAQIYAAVKAEFQAQGVYFAQDNELAALNEAIIDPDKNAVRPSIPGQSAAKIAQLAGIDIPEATPVLIAEIKGVGDQYPLSHEKLSPVLAMIKAQNREEGIQLCEAMLDLGGLGHTASLHTTDEDLPLEFAKRMKACRVLVNTPSAQGGIGDLYNDMLPSLTLGCGSYGHNSISHNVSTIDLLNIKTLTNRRNNMQWMKLPSKIYFEKNSVNYLEKMADLNKVFIVADQGMVDLGYVRIVEAVLARRSKQVQVQTFTDVQPDPSTDTIYQGAEAMKQFQPDTVVAIGGGSVMDAAKGMCLFYNSQDADFFGAKQKFLDIRKRTYKFPNLDRTKLICIPTTSGTGSEVTPFAVITDSETHIKYPLADYALTPDVAIVDSQFIESVPSRVVAHTGMDVLCHATESYVSVMASNYTKGLSLQAIKLVFDNLQASYAGDKTAKANMHDASTMAGMAFANALLGINHSLAHKLGGAFNLPHGLMIAITMPHVIRYNAKTPTKRALWAKYSYFRADEDYAEIARYLGLPGKNTAELVAAYADAVTQLAKNIGIKMRLRDNGVTQADFDRHVADLAELAYEDNCTVTNPKEPLIKELKGILEAEF